MNDAAQTAPVELVDLLDDHGNPIGTKPHAEVDRRTDALHCVQILFLDREHVIALTRLPARSAWAGRLSGTIATIVRHEEAVEVAALRCCKKELGIEPGNIHYLGESFEVLEGGLKRLLSHYMCVWNEPITLNPEDGELVLMTKDEFLQRLAADRTQFSPAFLALWDRYHNEIPL